MTSEGERSEPSKKASGDEGAASSEDDRRESSKRRAGGAARRHASSEDDRRESSKRRAGGTRGGSRNKLRTDGGTAGEIPLNIADHDAEKESRARDDPDDDGVLSEFDVSDPRGDDDEVEPVELLVQLADDGEIDPWDIDVVRVTDKFLDRLDGSDLRTGGRALFYASVLLRMKSDVMWIDDEPEEPQFESEPWERTPGEDPPEGFEPDPFARLDREMDRRIERKRARGMPETLDELVRDLREHERDTWWKESRTYDTSGSPSGYSRGMRTLDYHTGDDFRLDDEPTAEEVTGQTHDEHMEDIINDVYRALRTHYDRGRDEVLFVEVRAAGGSVVNTFLGLLFLANRGQIRLQQDELFGDLWIRDPGATPIEESVSADD